MPPEIQSLDHLVLTVRDIQVTVGFYTKVLGVKAEEFTPDGGVARQALIFGQQKINLHQSNAEFEPKALVPMPGSADLCFLSDTPLSLWARHLTALGVNIEEGPVQRTGAQGRLKSLYVRDPDGNLIEISNQIGAV